jgi:hypothetical protein
MPVKERISEQQSEAEHEHLHGQQPQHRRRDRKASALSDIARNLGKLDAREMDFLPRQMRSVFRHFAEELPDSAICLWRARHLHG